MKHASNIRIFLSAGAAAFALAACQTTIPIADTAPTVSVTAATQADFEADRQAILAMAGNYQVSFDFIETVPFVEGYDLKDRKTSGAHEVVRVIEDTGNYISLQHILVVGGTDEKFPVKHWRQDWRYEPAQVLVFVGGNAWEMRDVPAPERAGTWSQTVYQVDDSPRYGAVAAWSHENGLSEWVPTAEWRPLPRRDMTTRNDYHAVLAVNRHVITPDGWVHEQDNSKLVLSGEAPQTLVREIGVNTYKRFDDFQIDVAEDYWEGTADYWAEVRADWTGLENTQGAFALTLKGEPQDLYTPLMGYAEEYMSGNMTLVEASAKADETVGEFTTGDLGALTDRLRDTSTLEVAQR